MPEVSRFFGILISINYNDHAPPHFHVRYAGQQAAMRIADLAVMAGSLSPRALALTVEWAATHQAELQADWELARQGLPLLPIAPLD
jgi:hypothetical protein